MAMKSPNKDLVLNITGIVEGRTVVGTGQQHAHIYPGTGELTTELTLASAADVGDAVEAARRAFPAWRDMPGDQRRNLMFRLADLIDQNAQLLAELSTIEAGIPSIATSSFSADAAQKMRYFGGWADKIQGRTISNWGGPSLDYVRYEPYGVIGAITPWNGALFAATMVMAPALAAGNCIVVKIPDLAPYAVLKLGELIIEAGFPAGVVNMLVGGADVGAAIVAHPGVDKVQFVGSGAVAKKVLQSAAETLKPCGLELGGKSAVIVFDDAELPAAAQKGLMGAVMMSGQGCSNGTRLLVQRSIYPQYLEMLKGVAGYFHPADPYDPSTIMGPIISEVALNRISDMVDQAVGVGGVELLCGGKRLEGDHAGGFYYPLTILANVDNQSDIAQHEVFGPVMSVIPFDDEDEAIALTNATPYGLGGYIHTQNLRRAHHVASKLDSGMLHINGVGEGMSPCNPFGGVKQSGFGRLGGEEGLHEFLRVKNVWVDLAQPAVS